MPELTLFRLAIEAAPTGMLMVDAAGRIALVNAQVEKLFGYTRQELIGQPLEMLVPDRFRARHPGFRTAFFTAPQTRPMGAGRDLYGVRKDGSELPIEIALNPLTTPDGEEFWADRGPAKIVVEESGPLRACVRIEGSHFSQPQRMFRYIVRLHAFQGKPYVKVHYTFLNDHEPELMTNIRSLNLQLSLAGQEHPRNLLHRRVETEGRIRQLDDERCEVNQTVMTHRGAGWAAVADEQFGAAVGIREFWQNWPKGFDVSPGLLKVGLCPDFPADAYAGKPLAEECQHSYYLRGGVYAFKIGVSRTQELWANFFAGRPDAERLDDFFASAESPLIAQCSPERICTTQVIGRALPANPRRFQGYDLLVEEMFDEHLRDRARLREYGLLNYGDWYNTNWDSWGNLEYDTSRIWFSTCRRIVPSGSAFIQSTASSRFCWAQPAAKLAAY